MAARLTRMGGVTPHNAHQSLIVIRLFKQNPENRKILQHYSNLILIKEEAFSTNHPIFNLLGSKCGGPNNCLWCSTKGFQKRENGISGCVNHCDPGFGWRNKNRGVQCVPCIEQCNFPKLAQFNLLKFLGATCSEYSSCISCSQPDSYLLSSSLRNYMPAGVRMYNDHSGVSGCFLR